MNTARQTELLNHLKTVKNLVIDLNAALMGFADSMQIAADEFDTEDEEEVLAVVETYSGDLESLTMEVDTMVAASHDLSIILAEQIEGIETNGDSEAS